MTAADLEALEARAETLGSSPPAASASRVGGAMPTLSKLFVVTRSRRTSEYVTYSCRLPVVDRAAAGATAGWS